MDRIFGRKINVMESVIDIPPQEVITADNPATVQIDAVCFFQGGHTASEPAVPGQQPRTRRSESAANQYPNPYSARWNWMRMLSQRDGINEKLLKTVDEATAPWGINI